MKEFLTYGKITFEDGSSCDANQLLLDITEIWRENFASRPVTGIVLGTSGEPDKYIVSVDGDLCLVKMVSVWHFIRVIVV